jgi:hypothetical protein
MAKLEELKKRLRPGEVYRREELSKWSTSVDRHLQELVLDGKLEKLPKGYTILLNKLLLAKHLLMKMNYLRTFGLMVFGYIFLTSITV